MNTSAASGTDDPDRGSAPNKYRVPRVCTISKWTSTKYHEKSHGKRTALLPDTREAEAFFRPSRFRREGYCVDGCSHGGAYELPESFRGAYLVMPKGARFGGAKQLDFERTVISLTYSGSPRIHRQTPSAPSWGRRIAV